MRSQPFPGVPRPLSYSVLNLCSEVPSQSRSQSPSGSYRDDGGLVSEDGSRTRHPPPACFLVPVGPSLFPVVREPSPGRRPFSRSGPRYLGRKGFGVPGSETALPDPLVPRLLGGVSDTPRPRARPGRLEPTDLRSSSRGTSVPAPLSTPPGSVGRRVPSAPRTGLVAAIPTGPRVARVPSRTDDLRSLHDIGRSVLFDRDAHRLAAPGPTPPPPPWGDPCVTPGLVSGLGPTARGWCYRPRRGPTWRPGTRVVPGRGWSPTRPRPFPCRQTEGCKVCVPVRHTLRQKEMFTVDFCL